MNSGTRPHSKHGTTSHDATNHDTTTMTQQAIAFVTAGAPTGKAVSDTAPGHRPPWALSERRQRPSPHIICQLRKHSQAYALPVQPAAQPRRRAASQLSSRAGSPKLRAARAPSARPPRWRNQRPSTKPTERRNSSASTAAAAPPTTAAVHAASTRGARHRSAA